MMTRKNTGQKLLHGPVYFLLAGVLVIVIFALMTMFLQSRSRVYELGHGISRVQNSAVASDLYLIVREANNLNRVLRVEPNSGSIRSSFEAGYASVVTLTSDQKILYLFNQSLAGATEEKGTLSAIDPRTGDTKWKVKLPGGPLTGSATTGAWLSADESSLYLQATLDGLQIHIFTIDIQTKSLVQDFDLPLPYPSNQGFPLVWKLPWAESLVVVSRNQLFTVDLISGKASASLGLDKIENVQRIPKNFPLYYFVQDGVINPDTQQLILATASQEIISVNLDAEPFVTQSVFSLPVGWQFGGRHVLATSSQGASIYIQVKREDTPIHNGSEVEEIWVFDTNNWTGKSQINLPEYVAVSQQNSPSNLDLTNYDLAVSNDGQGVYALTANGILLMSQDFEGRLNGTWLMNIENLPPLLRYEVVR